MHQTDRKNLVILSLLLLAGVVVYFCWVNRTASLVRLAEVGVAGVTTGAAATQGAHARTTAHTGVQGQLLYASHTAVYGAQGYMPPWDNYLVLRAFGTSASRTCTLTLPPDTFAVQPALSPDGGTVAFKVGQADGVNARFAVFLLALQTRALVPVGTAGEQVTGWRPLCWSPNSRYLAYIDGDYHWGNTHYAPPELWIYDRERRTNRLVLKARDLMAHIAWTPEGQLLYSLFPEPWGRLPEKPRPPDALPGVYRLDLAGGTKARRILPDATEPAASPDGRWIAAFATASAPDGEAWPFRRRLTLYPTGGGTPIPLSARDSGRGTQARWSPDSRHLYVFAEQYTARGSFVVITDYAPASHLETVLASLKNQQLADPVTADHGIVPLTASRDGRILFFCDLQAKENVPHTGTRALHALDLTTRAISTLYRVDGYGEMAWRDEAKP